MSDSLTAPQIPPLSENSRPVSDTRQLPPELNIHKPSFFPKFALFFGPFMYKASWRLPVYGFFCALCCGIVAWLFWGTVLAENLGFWLHFGQL